jgi:serine/threonine-protein kinase
MGEVYLGHDPRLERRVALKCLIASGATRDDDRARVLREARAAARLNHPNIAAVYDVLQQDDRTFIVMEYVEGESLSARLMRERIPMAQVRRIGRQLASALAAAHAQGVIHRDLKPANIHLAPDGTIKVLDFGVAKIEREGGTIAGHTSSSSNPGTPVYMSPEQLLGHPLDGRSDIYSAGVILYQLATGQRPFEELNPVALALAMQSRRPVPPCKVSPDVPRELSAVIDRMLERDPADRFQSIRDVEVLLTSSETAPAVSRPARRPRVKVATGVWISVTAAAVLLILGLVGRPLLHRAGPAPAVATASLDSIAVVPLENLSSDPNQEYLADGMTESIITELGRVRSLRVISRQSMMQFKHTRATIPQIASQLGVRAVMTGSVMRDGDRLRVTIALMEPTPERQLWAETYERAIGDALTLSNEVAQTAMKNVRVRLTPAEEARLAQVRPMKPDAQQAYLLGRFFWNKRTKGDNEQAIQHFRRAIDLDPTAALAYAGLADCYVIAVDTGWAPPDESYRQAKAYAAKAIELDNSIAEAHATLGVVYQLSLLWRQAEEEFQIALAANPGYTPAHRWRATELGYLGRHAEAIAEARQALEQDPLSASQTAFLGLQMHAAGDYTGAVEQFNKALKLAPDFGTAHLLLGRTYLEQRRYPEAIREFEEAVRLDAGDAGELGHAYAIAGNRAAAERILSELLDRSRAEYVRPLQIAYVELGLGNRAAALDWVEKAYRAREGVVGALATDPRLSPIAGEPRFRAILDNAGLTFNPGRPQVALH